jgi:hypothetical protein
MSKTTTKTKNKPKKKTPLEKKVKAAEKNIEHTREFQKKYDNSERLILYKYNKFECHKCKYDKTIVSLVFWQDPESKEMFMNVRTVCGTACDERDNIYDMKLKDLPKEKIFDFNY